MTETVEQIARRLSEVQKRWMTEKAEQMRTAEGRHEQWFCYAPTLTFEVLVRQGLVDRYGLITPLGLALKTHLQEQGS